MPVNRRFSVLSALTATIALAGCASLPSSGPTARQVVKGVESDQNTIGMKLVPLDAKVVAEAARRDVEAEAGTRMLASLTANASNDVIGPGDTLQVSIFEVGVTLFGGSRSSIEGYDPSSQVERFPPVTVDSKGLI